MKARTTALLLLLQSAVLEVGYSSVTKKENYQPLIEKFRESEHLEKTAFAQLVFTFSPQQLKQSMVFKFVVRDQLGRDWLFKGGDNSGSDGAVLIYRIYKLFGLETPEVHKKDFILNGKKISGSVQRLVPNLGNLHQAYPNFSQLPATAHEYLAKNHILSWLMANHQTYGRQFLITTNDGKTASGITRIDNGVEWFVIGTDSLDLDYEIPNLWHLPSVGNAGFWRAYLMKYIPVKKMGLNASQEKRLETAISKRKIDVDLNELYEWGHYISRFPNKTYREILQESISSDLAKLSNNHNLSVNWMSAPEVMQQTKINKANLVTALTMRRASLASDLEKFLNQVMAAQGTKFHTKRALNDSNAAKSLIEKLDKKIATAKNDLVELAKPEKSALMQADFELPVSFTAYQAFSQVAWTRFYSSLPERKIIIEETIAALEKESAQATIKSESAAFATAIGNFKRLLALCDHAIANREAHAPAQNPWLAITELMRFFEPGWIDAVAPELGFRGKAVP